MIFLYVGAAGLILLLNFDRVPDAFRLVFEHAFSHEQLVTSLINGLVDLAIEEKDHATKNFLDYFVDEQVEEEASASEIVQQLKFIGDNGYGILMLDRELGQRIYTPPAQEE